MCNIISSMQVLWARSPELGHGSCMVVSPLLYLRATILTLSRIIKKEKLDQTVFRLQNVDNLFICLGLNTWLPVMLHGLNV